MSNRTGDAKVAELFDAHARALLLYARQWVGPADAEDVLQRIFVKLLAGDRLPAEPRSWLFRCARNEAIAIWRSHKRRSRREQAVASESSGWFVPSPGDPLDARAAQAALESLPAEQREAVALRLWGGLTLSETADVTGVAISTAQRRYVAAIEALRQKLEDPCKTPNR
jgi:RNA polymerase sigma-70 factor (ECF subfamily)